MPGHTGSAVMYLVNYFGFILNIMEPLGNFELNRVVILYTILKSLLCMLHGEYVAALRMIHTNKKDSTREMVTVWIKVVVRWWQVVFPEVDPMGLLISLI